MDRFDVMVLIGLGMLAGGLYLVSPALALIVPGGCVMVLGVVGAWIRANGASRRPPDNE